MCGGWATATRVLRTSPLLQHPLAFVRVPVDDAAARLANALRSQRPQVMLTFGPEGLYGHPDHLHTYHVALRAIQMAADPLYPDPGGAAPWRTPSLYFAAFPREEMQAMLNQGRFDWLSPEARANLGTPLADITHTVDIGPWSDRKRAAIAAHETQTGPGGPLSDIPPDAMETRWRREHFVRVPLPWSKPKPPTSSLRSLGSRRRADLPKQGAVHLVPRA